MTGRADGTDLLIRVVRVTDRAILPVKQTEGSSGWDLHACLEAPLRIPPMGRAAVPTGLSVAVPGGYELQIRPRSGLALRKGVTVVNAPGTIDSDYRGELKVLLVNLGDAPFEIRHGDRVAQMVLAHAPRGLLEVVERLEETSRGAGGFGHTGLGADASQTEAQRSREEGGAETL
jgi:dUTP pyrophosphatase